MAGYFMTEKNVFLHVHPSLVSEELGMLLKSIDDGSTAQKLDYAARRARYTSEIHELDDEQHQMVKGILLLVIGHMNTPPETISQIGRWILKDRHEHYVLMKRLLGEEPPKELWYSGRDIMDAIEKRPFFYGDGKKALRN